MFLFCLLFRIAQFQSFFELTSFQTTAEESTLHKYCSSTSADDVTCRKFTDSSYDVFLHTAQPVQSSVTEAVDSERAGVVYQLDEAYNARDFEYGSPQTYSTTTEYSLSVEAEANLAQQCFSLVNDHFLSVHLTCVNLLGNTAATAQLFINQCVHDAYVSSRPKGSINKWRIH